MKIDIRAEQEGDLTAICCLIKEAFATVAESDHREHILVQKLHSCESYVPQLSLVAETDTGEIVGYILLSEVLIVQHNHQRTKSLAVAPLAVMPEYQNNGIGGRLIGEAHKRATSLGYDTAVLLGHKDYYPRFGYRKAIDFGIKFPFDVPDEFCMVVELKPDSAKNISGTVLYPNIFFE